MMLNNNFEKEKPFILALESSKLEAVYVLKP